MLGKNLKEPDAKDIEYKSAFCSYLRKGTEHSLSNLEIKSSLVGDNNKFGYSITTRMSEQISDLLARTSVMRQIAKVDEVSTDALELIEDREDTDAG
ncbi:MAG: phage major capsid protein [Candidatus Midichloria sp.]